MALAGINRATGKRHIRVYDSAGTIAAGDTVQFNESGEVVVGAAGAEILGLALESATSTTTVTVDVAYPGDEFTFPIEAGTMATATLGTEIDLNSADGVDVGLSTNDDVMVTLWDKISTTTGNVTGTFRRLAVSAGVV